MNSSPALSIFLGVLLSTQILIILSLRATARHILGHLHELVTLLAPLKVELPQLKASYAEGYKAGILEQTRRQNEELNSPKSSTGGAA
jgi:hypothetical protein